VICMGIRGMGKNPYGWDTAKDEAGALAVQDH
jgi:hypothetical protein